jgi:hypothetical protein
MKKKFLALSLISVFCFILTGNIFAEPNKPADVKKTEVVIIGTIHDYHHKNPKYSPDVLKEIISALKPDAILNELPLSLVEPNGRPLKQIRGKWVSPEDWAADSAAQQLGIKQIPFDRPDRQENFKKTNYFERLKRANELADKWYGEAVSKEPNSIDLKIANLRSFAGQAEARLITNSGPEIINSDAYDSVARIKHSLWHDIMPAILQMYPGYETLVEDYRFEKSEWQTRSRIMADNIIKAAREYEGKRLVVVTGGTHRYDLRDLLKNEPGIELKEFWEIVERQPDGTYKAMEEPAFCKVTNGRIEVKRLLRYDEIGSVDELEFDDRITSETYEFIWSKPDEPYLKKLCREYKLDEIIAGCNSDYEKVQAICHWVNELWSYNGVNTPKKSDPISILKEAKGGAQFRCVEYSKVISGCLNALGIPARVLSLRTKDVETRLFSAGHVVTEAYISKFEKWIMIDGQWDVIPVLNDVPLSAVELQRALAQKTAGLGILTSSKKTAEEYFSWIAEYLFYFVVPLDNRISIEDSLPDKVMLVPSGAKEPEVFQRYWPIKNTGHTNSIRAFYAKP